MSGYKGHRGPNVSQYIANLNQLSPTHDVLLDPLPLDDDFAAFLNADFFDATKIHSAGPAAAADSADREPSIDLDAALASEQSRRPTIGDKLPSAPTTTAEDSTMDFTLNDDIQFTDFNNFGPNPIFDPSLQSIPATQSNLFTLPPTFVSPSSSLSPTVPDFNQSGAKANFDDVAGLMPQSFDEESRVAAEEDKRRRNTAASARFRVKKKQREQALEKTAKAMTDKVNLMEVRIQQLETENTWLKSLITEKNGGKSSTAELKALLSKREESNNGRSSPARTDGVGTKARGSKADA